MLRKKYYVIFSLLAMLVLMICLAPSIMAEKTEEKVEITMSVWGMPWEDKLYTDFAIPRFEKENPDIKVNFVRLEDYWNKLIIRHAGGEAPDVMRNADEQYGQMRLRGALKPLTEYINDPEIGISLDDFHKIAMKSLKVDGEIWALPQDLSTKTVLFYNKAIFDEAGVDYPNSEWTIENLIDAAKKLTKGQRPRLQQYGLTWSSPYFIISMIYGFGGRLWSEDRKRCVINSPENVKTLKFMQGLVYKYGVSPSSNEVSMSEARELFKGGKVAMNIDGGWAIPSYTRDVPELDFAVAPMPKAPLGTTTLLGQCIWTMSSQTKHPKAAWKLIKYLSSFEVLKEYWQRTWVAAPARLSLVFGKEFENIIGIEGIVPNIKTPERFEELLGWARYIIKNDKFTNDYVNAFWLPFRYQYLTPAAEQIFGPSPGDVESILEEVENGTNKEIEGF